MPELPDDSAERYRRLQEDGILARIDQQQLEGSTLELNAQEMHHLHQFRRLPDAAESRLGLDAQRTRRLFRHVMDQDPDWPILIFSTSVAHAQVLAALFSHDGRSAASISGETDPAIRRHYVEEFRRGRLKVLTNHSVLTAGFDAPAVRALYVARLVYSPVAYQQMIGRGLRGPRNGGKEYCLVVNVKDNITQYGGELAFTQFEHLWSGETALKD